MTLGIHEFFGVLPATAETWARWHDADSAELWQAVALQVALDPELTPWRRLKIVVYYKWRVDLALHSFENRSLPCMRHDAAEPWRSIVRLDEFRMWSLSYLLPLPTEFPEGGAAQGLPTAPARPPVMRQAIAAPEPAAGQEKPAKRRKAASSSEYLREQQLLSELVPFSHATLWRRVKSGKFPKPQKFGSITAWKRTDIEAWLKAHTPPQPAPKPAGKRST